jgi:hypothetical protein
MQVHTPMCHIMLMLSSHCSVKVDLSALVDPIYDANHVNAIAKKMESLYTNVIIRHCIFNILIIFTFLGFFPSN